jgi:hypothetical protein
MQASVLRPCCSGVGITSLRQVSASSEGKPTAVAQVKESSTSVMGLMSMDTDALAGGFDVGEGGLEIKVGITARIARMREFIVEEVEKAVITAV